MIWELRIEDYRPFEYDVVYILAGCILRSVTGQFSNREHKLHPRNNTRGVHRNCCVSIIVHGW
jgi:hypothetical protein